MARDSSRCHVDQALHRLHCRAEVEHEIDEEAEVDAVLQRLPAQITHMRHSTDE